MRKVIIISNKYLKINNIKSKSMKFIINIVNKVSKVIKLVKSTWKKTIIII